MEQLSAHHHQLICAHCDDDVGETRPQRTMIPSATSREMRWLGGAGQPSVRPSLDPYSPQQPPSSAIYTGGMDPLRRRQRSSLGVRWGYLLVMIASLWVLPASAVMIEFQNCLPDFTKNDRPLDLQFVPMFLDAVFNTTNPSHNLRVTVWGNVTGSFDQSTLLPPANDTQYWNSNRTDLGGKILDIPFPEMANPKITTLFNKVNVLTYEPWSSSSAWCGQLKNASCPLGPNFTANASNPYELASFGFSNNFYSTYAFTSFTTTLTISYGDPHATIVGCTSANITPDLGSILSGVVTFIPLVVLISVGVATAFAAIFSPWGTTDTFRWTSNYGRDADLLRLVTPGFGDCLQYIQFVVLTGGLALNYPGFYQPVVSKVSWSTLMFNESFVRDTTPNESVIDGIYVTRGDYGLDRLRQLVGLGQVDDIWAGMMIWLLVILAGVLVLIQIGFACRWAYRHINNTTEEDLRAKNMPFSMGNVIRIVFNYFLLPIVALSMFQLVVAAESPSYTVGLAALTLVLIVGFAIWLLYLIASTRPKAFLFDDLPTVLLYGSLYNTYSDDAAAFALVPVLLTFVRGAAIGAVQPSGVAQLVLLAICEVITILTLHAFRPFHSPTSMNAYHTFFAVLRLSTVLLMVSFAPSLGVTEGPKGWIGYAILLMHAIVLIFGFFLNAIQTIVEVAARMAGAGGDESGAARGGLVKVFGMRQLSRRLPRRDAGSRQSQLSSAAMLANSDNERKSSFMLESGRMRSQSAGSNGMLLNRASTGLDSIGIDPFGAIPPHQLASGHSSYTPTTPGEASTFSFLPSAAAPANLGRNRGPPVLGLSTAELQDPYYRPPRARRPTNDAYSPGGRSRGSWASGEWANKAEPGTPDQTDTFEGPSISGRNTPVPPQAYDGSPNEPRRSKADYTTREVDFYYGVRGPALNANIPSRRIKTGPADPTGPAASAAGWFKGFFGGKTKEKGKGFEVVRSSRMPPGMNMQARNAPGQTTLPEGIPVATGGIRNGPIDSDDESVHAGPSNTNDAERGRDSYSSPRGSDDGDARGDFVHVRVSDLPPSLPGLDIEEGGIELPSRFPSKATSRASSGRFKTPAAPMPEMPSRGPSRRPALPRKSSRRKSQSVDLSHPDAGFLRQHQAQSSLDSSRFPFDRSNSIANRRDSTVSAVSSNGEADVSRHTRETSSALGHFSADLGDERPTSVGYVHHHNIQTINPTNNPEFLGSAAEVVDGRSRSNTASQDNRL